MYTSEQQRDDELWLRNLQKGGGIKELQKWDFSKAKFSEILSKIPDSDFFDTENKIKKLEECLLALDMSHFNDIARCEKRLLVLRKNLSRILECINDCYADKYSDTQIVKTISYEIKELESSISKQANFAKAEVEAKTKIELRLSCLHRAEKYRIEESRLNGNGMTVSRVSLKTVRGLSQEIVSDVFSTDVDVKQMKVANKLFKDMIHFIKNFRK